MEPTTVDMNQALIRLSEKDSARFWKEDFATLSAPERVFRVVWELESQVNNGGFDQFFYNSAGDVVAHAAGFLEEIGAAQMARIVRSAASVFGPAGPALDREQRRVQLDDLDDDQADALESLDAEFYGYPENLTELLYRYVQQNRAQIRGAGDVL